MPEFLERKLKKEYPSEPAAPYKIMNKLGVMHGNKETAKGRAEEKKHEVAHKMKAYKPSKQKKGESDRDHWHRLGKEFYEHGKDLPKGKPASYYK